MFPQVRNAWSKYQKDFGRWVASFYLCIIQIEVPPQCVIVIVESLSRDSFNSWPYLKHNLRLNSNDISRQESAGECWYWKFLPWPEFLPWWLLPWPVTLLPVTSSSIPLHAPPDSSCCIPFIWDNVLMHLSCTGNLGSSKCILNITDHKDAMSRSPLLYRITSDLDWVVI